MPNVAKSDYEWQRTLRNFAASKSTTLPRGCAPPKGSKWHSELEKIRKCPFGTSHPFKPKEVRGCECGYHEPANETGTEDNAKASSLAGTNLERVVSKQLIANMPRKPEPLNVAEVRDVIGWRIRKDQIDLFVYGPTTGTCPLCRDGIMRPNAVSRMKLVYRQGWPCYLIGLDLRCRECEGHCLSFDSKYRATLPPRLQPFPFIISGGALAVCKKLILALRMGVAAKVLEEQIRATLRSEYMGRKRDYENAAAAKLALKLAGSFEPFPPFPEEYVAKSPALLQAFLVDYEMNREDMRREQAALVSSTAIAIDNQRKVVKRVKVNVSEGQVGTQSLTAVGDGGIILGYYVVPDVSKVWMKMAMDELVQRHQPEVPKLLYVDSGCCGGKLIDHSDATQPKPHQYEWEEHFRKKLDVMHLILRIGREANAEHPRRKAFLKQISRALFQDSQADLDQLEMVRKEAGLKLTDEQKRIDRYKYVRRTIGEPKATCAKLLLVVKAHIALDRAAAEQCRAAGMKTEGVTVASPSYPLITHSVKNAVMNQCIHILNGCVSDEGISYVKIADVDYRNTGFIIPMYKSLRGTSKVEAIHSTLDRAFYSMRNFRSRVFDARATWHVANFNRRRLRAMGKPSIPCGVAPCEDDDAILAPPEAAKNLKLGFEYANAVMGQVLKEELDGEPESDDDVVPVEGLMIDDSDGGSDTENENLLPRSGIENIDLTEGVKPEDLNSLNIALESMINEEPQKRNVCSPKAPAGLANIESLCTPVSQVAHVEAPWSQPSGEISQARKKSKRDVGRRRALGGSLVEVTPDFNNRMTELWKDIWAKSSATRPTPQLVREALAEYKRFLVRDDPEDQPGWEPLLPVSYAGALEWMKQMQAKCHNSVARGIFNEEGAKIVNQLDCILQVPTLLTIPSEGAEDGNADIPPVEPEEEAGDNNGDLPSALSLESIGLVSKKAENEKVRLRKANQVTRRIARQKDREKAKEARAHPPQAQPKWQQRCRICKSLIGSYGHPRGQCPFKDLEIKVDPNRERRRRAEEEILRLGLDVPEELPKGETRCSLCNMSRGGEHIIRNNKVIYCPYADPTIVKEEYEESRKALELARYERYNKKRRHSCL